MSSSEFDSSDQSSSDSSVLEEDGGAYVEETFFGPKPWHDGPLTHQRLTAVVQKWVCEDWDLRPGQFEVVKALRPKGRMFCGFPTAAGKTLIACANALLDFAAGVEGVHIICQPLQALVGQTATNMAALYFARTRIEVVVWGKLDHELVTDIEFKGKVVVILASPEELEKVFVECKKQRARVRGLMVDEAHLREEWPFRNYLASDRFTSTYPDAMVGIFSASLDDAMVSRFKESMALLDSVVFDRSNVPVLRTLELQRLNQLVIRCCPLSKLRRSIVAAVETLADGDSIVVFASTYDVLSRNESLLFCPEIAHLNPRVYAAVFAAREKEETVRLFKELRCRLVISTCAFGTGVDFPHIRYVFFDNAPKSWPSFMQYAGRAGRGDFSKQVFITMAFSPNDIKLSDRRVQVLAFYCPKAKSSAAKKVKIKCPDCQEEHVRPPIKDFTGRCFDFEGVACNTTRQACLRTIAGFYQGLFKDGDLHNRSKDCGQCSACDRKDADDVRFVVGNKVRVKPNHVKHAGAEGVVVKVGSRISFRHDDGSQHALSGTNLSLESTQVFAVPEKAQKNGLDKDARARFANLIRAELLQGDVATGGLFFANLPNETDISEASKHKSNAILPAKKFKVLMVKAEKGDMAQIDHVKGFSVFLKRHEKAVETAGAEKLKRARTAINMRRNP
jgi:superfamily II DNA helicase RecQ